LEDCIERDPKGLYKKAINGEIKGFTRANGFRKATYDFFGKFDKNLILRISKNLDKHIEIQKSFHVKSLSLFSVSVLPLWVNLVLD